MRLTVTDASGASDRITVRVAVLDVDEPPVLEGGVAEVDYAEDSRGPVGEFSASDPEGPPSNGPWPAATRTFWRSAAGVC